MKNLISLFIFIIATTSVMANAVTRCPDQVQTAAEGALNNSSSIDPNDPFFKASGNPKLISEEPLLEGSLPNLKVQTWSVSFDLGIDGGGKLEVGIISIGEGSSTCRLVSGFWYHNGVIKKLAL